MPIPVLRKESPRSVAVPTPPKPVHWGNTYVSVTGANGKGEEIPLTGFHDTNWPGVVMLPGSTGLDAPPFELHADDSPNLDGGIFRNARAVAREVMIPVYLFGIDRRTLKVLKKKLVSALNPKKGYCVLKFVEGDGVARYLYCYYKGGMEGSEETDQAGFTWKKFGIQFTAYDPYFYSDDIGAATWTFGAGEAFFSDTAAFIPLRINAGLVLGSEITIDNPGDVEAWPVWTLTGPIKSFTFTSPPSEEFPQGQSFGIPTASDGSDILPTGRTLTIDTRPGYKSLKDDQGKNYWPLLAAQPELWPIPDGTSTCSVDILPGNDTATVKLSYRPRYEGY